MDLRQLRYFAATVEEGSLHGAAQRLRVAQPALSRRIRDLEEGLGCALLVRGPRGIVPTPAGAALYADALTLLASVDRAGQRARHAAAEGEGVVRLGLMPGTRKYGFVRDAVAAFAAIEPRRTIDYLRAPSAELAAALRGGRLDAALLYERHPGSAEFAERPIHRERYLLAAPPAHGLAASPEPLEPAALAGERLIWLARQEAGDEDRLLAACRLHGLEPLVAHRARSHEEQLDLVAVGAGCCLTPASTVAAVPPAQLAFRPLARFDLDLPLGLAWRREARLAASALVGCFERAIDAHQAALARGLPAWSRLAGVPTVLPDRR